jgi:putative PIN family toxin of toxin-antitoxin system
VKHYTTRSHDIRLVLDTNTVLCGLANDQSPSDVLLRLCEARAFRLLLSKPIAGEYRTVLGYKKVTDQYPEITAEAVELVIRRLRYVSEEYARVAVHFQFPRDPREAKFIELAIVGQATHIISHDLDLLTLKAAHTETGKRFRQRLPRVEITKAGDFLLNLESKGILPP